MSPRLARLCLAAVSSAVTTGLVAQTPSGTPSPLPQTPRPQPGATAPAASAPVQTNTIPAAPGTADQPVMLVMPDADIETVLSALEMYTGRTILRPQQLQTATYNLKIKTPIPRWEAILAIETILSLNNIAVVPLGERFLKVVNTQMAKQEAPEMITGSTLDRPPSGKVASKIFQLEFLRVQEFTPMLQQGVLNALYGGPVAFQNANAVLITDSISNLQRVEMLLQQVDRPVTAGMRPKFFTLKNGAKASDVVNKLRTILTGTLTAQLGQATTYSADDRTNQIIVVTDPRQWDFFSELIERLDQKSDPNTRNEVIPLKHAMAADVVKVLTNIINGQNTVLQRSSGGSVRAGQGLQPTQPATPTPAAPNQPAQANIVSGTNSDASSNEFSAFMTVVNDERTNSVIVSGTTDDIRLVKELVAKLDITLAQVRIEVVVAEVTLTDNNQTGISQLGLKVEGDKLVGFSLAAVGASVLGADGASGSLASITRPGTSGRWDLAGLVSLGTSDRTDNTTILSNPTITTSHAKSGNVFVGETRPVISGTVVSGTGGGTTSTTTQLQIGIDLTVKPLIGVDGSVQLEIKQAVDEVGADIEIDGNPQPIVLKRTMDSFVTVKSGEIIVLGGLQRRSEARKTSRLGPIPIIGDLFGPRQKRVGRTDLVFFIRPHVLTNTPADNEAAMRQINELPHRDAVRKQLDPNYEAPKKSLLDKILPK